MLRIFDKVHCACVDYDEARFAVVEEEVVVDADEFFEVFAIEILLEGAAALADILFETCDAGLKIDHHIWRRDRLAECAFDLVVEF